MPARPLACAQCGSLRAVRVLVVNLSQGVRLVRGRPKPGGSGVPAPAVCPHQFGVSQDVATHRFFDVGPRRVGQR